MRIMILLAIAAALAIPPISTVSADNGPEPGASPPASAEQSVGDIVIGAIERRILRDYYHRHLEDWEQEQGGNKNKNKKKGNGNGKELPPGLAKRGELPPGLAKQLVRNGHLPPGLEGRDLPPDLLARLPQLDPAYRYVIADDKVMLVRRATNVILDILTVAAVDLLD
ncbi:hypothetical protein [Dongia sp.]|uniref:hypothetical protein n=1 Tax=Dongia sp. TaxID=1977262 RepID=UPI0035AEA32F